MTDAPDPIAARDQAFQNMIDIAERTAGVIGAYRTSLVECWDIHPEVADRIAEDYAYNLHCQLFHGNCGHSG